MKNDLALGKKLVCQMVIAHCIRLYQALLLIFHRNTIVSDYNYIMSRDLWINMWFELIIMSLELRNSNLHSRFLQIFVRSSNYSNNL